MSLTKQQLLDSFDWSQIIKEVTVYTVHQFQYYSILHKKGIKGYTPEEIAMEAIEKVFTGEWNWDPSKSEISTYLKFHVVKGLIANLIRSKEVQHNVESDGSELLSLADENDSFNAVAIEDLVRQVRTNLNDEKVRIIFDGLLAGEKRRDVCEKNGWEKNVYDNALKRLHTVLEKLHLENILK